MSIEPETIYLMLVYATLGMVGACLGSFASAIAYRATRGQSWIKNKDNKSGKFRAARSACPLCNHQLAWFDLLPVVSWILSFGQCRYCHEKISIRYPVIELIGGVVLSGFFAFGAGEGLFILFSFVLPFVLAALVLIWNREKLPVYLYGALVLMILILCYVFALWA